MRYKQSDKGIQKKKEWWNENAEIGKIYDQRRRALKANLPNDFTVEDWKKTIEAFDNRCAYCGNIAPLAQDHYIPLTKGGPYSPGNIVPACKHCNSSKRNRLPEAFLEPKKRYQVEEILRGIDYGRIL